MGGGVPSHANPGYASARRQGSLRFIEVIKGEIAALRTFADRVRRGQEPLAPEAAAIIERKLDVITRQLSLLEANL